MISLFKDTNPSISYMYACVRVCACLCAHVSYIRVYYRVDRCHTAHTQIHFVLRYLLIYVKWFIFLAYILDTYISPDNSWCLVF